MSEQKCRNKDPCAAASDYGARRANNGRANRQEIEEKDKRGPFHPGGVSAF
jgi:hypothetical protein